MLTLCPQAIIVAGPNGAGKTTLAMRLLQSLPYEYLAADVIAKQLAPDSPEGVAIQAGRVFVDKVRTCGRARKNLIIETTLSGRSFRRHLKELRAVNYRIRLAFIFLKSATAHVERVRERVRKGGHKVPEQDIVRRYYRSKQNFWSLYRFLADEWQLFYNSGKSSVEVAFGEPNTFLVIHEQLFDVFLKNVIAQEEKDG